MKKSSEVKTPRTPACNTEIRAKNMCASFFSLHANIMVSGTTMFASITRGRPIPSIPVMYLTPRESIQDRFSVNCIPAALSNIAYMASEMNNGIADVTSETTRAIGPRFDKIPIAAPIKGSRIIRVINILHHPPYLHKQNQNRGSEYE